MDKELEERPMKRARPSSASATIDLVHDATLWFDDGNIILACGGTGFRVHAGVLSLNCGTFKDMLASGTPAAGEVYEGVDVVRLSDDPADMRLFLTPMYFLEYAYCPSSLVKKTYGLPVKDPCVLNTRLRT